MQLLRLATLHFSVYSERWAAPWSIQFGAVQVHSFRAWNLDGRLRLLVVASITLPYYPKLTRGKQIVVPKKQREQAEAAISSTANLIAMASTSKRSVSSPVPWIAFHPESGEEASWLSQAVGVQGQTDAISEIHADLELDRFTERLADRLDGVALLAEALSHEHATGKFHELVRLLERAFRLSYRKLAEPLFQFLAPTQFGYTRAEIDLWTPKLRDRLSHADVANAFSLEPAVWPVIGRMQQAAYDVLANKDEWRAPSTSRRKVWQPLAGTNSSDSRSLFVVQGAQPRMTSRLLDGFRVYPLDLGPGTGDLPSDWWYSIEEGEAIDAVRE